MTEMTGGIDVAGDFHIPLSVMDGTWQAGPGKDTEDPTAPSTNVT